MGLDFGLKVLDFFDILCFIMDFVKIVEGMGVFVCCVIICEEFVDVLCVVFVEFGLYLIDVVVLLFVG